MTVLKKKWNNEILVEMTYANIAHIYYEMMHICWCRRYFFRIVSAQSHYAAAEDRKHQIYPGWLSQIWKMSKNSSFEIQKWLQLSGKLSKYFTSVSSLYW